MSSLQEFVTYKEKTSDTSTCTANASEVIETTIALGHGVFEIISIEVDTAVQNFMDATFGWKATLATGATETHCFGSGKIRKYQNLVLNTPRIVEGPGVIYCNVVFLESGKTAVLSVSYRRLPQYEHKHRRHVLSRT